MLPKLDPTISPYVSEMFEPLDLDADDVPNPFNKFMSDAELAGAFRFRGHERVTRLRAETAELDKHFDDIMSAERLNNMHWQKAATADLDTEITSDDSRLEKMDSHSDRRKRTLSLWMQSELALGKSARELIDYAAKHDREVANLLQEIATELGEA